MFVPGMNQPPQVPSAPQAASAPVEAKFVQGLGLLDSTMMVAGSMIGSGIFIVSADIARQVGSAGWLLVVWLITGALTLTAALSYGELAAMMPRAGGQYVYLREAYSPLWGFLYGWTLFLVIQTGTIAAVAVAFARYLGVLVPAVSPDRLDHPAGQSLGQLRRQPLGAAIGGHPDDRPAHVHQHARAATRQAHPERLHLRQDAFAARAHPHRPAARTQRRRGQGQLQRPLDAARRLAHQA